MIDDLRKLAGQVSDPLDLATVLIFGTTGFVIDAGLNAVGFLDPGYVGVIAASGALGLKKSVEAGWTAARARGEEKREIEDERARAATFLHLLHAKGHKDLARQLARDLELFVEGIVGVENLKLSLEETIEGYRSREDQPRDDGDSPVTPGRFTALEPEPRNSEHKPDPSESVDESQITR